ncbi:MAG: site-2 protease family protein [Coriobacteriia bacterium]|nr:site-2 protease family protein [Coriobacteriia bacterium]MBN2839925.1 site-2 protease family protein [Coriobacteriia bacterium]
MFGLRSLRLGRLFGIPLEIDASWLFVFFLVAATLTTSYFPAALPDQTPVAYVALGLLTAIVFFASLVLHELAHSLVARAGGLRVSRVTLFVFGGVSQLEDEPRSPGSEFVMAAAGPVMSLLIGAGCWGLAIVGGLVGAPEWMLVPLDYLAIINVALAIFNLLPGFPLDGGRVLRAILWAATGDVMKATKWASRAGQALGTALIAVAVFGVLNGTFDFVWLAVMGWFMSTLAVGAYRQQLTRARLAEVAVSEIMSSPAVLAPADLSLEEMGHSYFLAGRHPRYPVVEDGRVIGLIDIERVNEVARNRWAETTVGEVASKNLEAAVARPEASVDSILPRLEPGGPGAILVVEDGRLAGIVTRSDIIKLVMDITRDREAATPEPRA